MAKKKEPEKKGLKKGFMRYVKTYATRSDLLGIDFSEINSGGSLIDKQQLVDIINNLPLGGLLNILSQLSVIPFDNKALLEDFIHHFELVDKNNLFDIRRYLQAHALYSQQTLLVVWKWLLAYGDKGRLDDAPEISQGIRQLIWLGLIISDYLSEKSISSIQLKYEMFRNAYFYATDDLALSTSRAYYVFIKIAQNKNLFNEKEYLDFNADFEKHYGYKIEEYLAVVFTLCTMFSKRRYLDIGPGWSGNLEHLFPNSEVNKKAKNIVGSLTIGFDEAKNWALQTLNSHWEFLLFQQKPLLALDDGTFFPIMPRLLNEQVFTGLFYKIRDCYPRSDKSLMDFKGRPFELYVKLLIEDATKSTSVPYQVFPEFKYGRGGCNRSPEFMLKLDNKLLAIEAKSNRMKIDSSISGDPTSVEDDMNKMVIKPFIQLHDRVSDLLKPNKHIDLSEVTDIYLMVVTWGDFPTLPPFEKQIRNETQKYFALNIKAFSHLDIEEFENLCYLISRKNSKPIFRILENKALNYPEIPFKNFLTSCSLPRKRPQFIIKSVEEVLSKIQSIVFPDLTKDA